MNSNLVDSREAFANAARFLGCAFSASDLIFEIDPDGSVRRPSGAAVLLGAARDHDLEGRALSELFKPYETLRLEALLTELQQGERRGPQRLRTVSGAWVDLSVFRMPQRTPFTSASIRGAAERAPAHVPQTLLSSVDWNAATASVLSAAASAGVQLNMDLVELAGLEKALAELPAPEAERVRGAVNTALNARSFNGSGATEVSPDRFAFLAEDEPPAEALIEDLGQIVGEGVSPQVRRLKLEAEKPGQNARALRYALDRFIEGGAAAAEEGFQGALRKTLADAGRFKDLVAKKAFGIAYQPVVSLADQVLHHFEALARFEADTSPAETIRLAEELDMTTEFDLVVAEMVLRVLAKDRRASVAVNISARSLVCPGFVDRFLGLTKSEPAVRKRLLVELTESAHLGDLRQANQQIQRLRQAGHRVCLDDFGAGAASFEYLLDLDVDVLKIDGRYVRGLVAEGRAATVICHLVALCDELGLTTIAEFVETAAVDELLRGFGVDLGQGWHYGKPQPTTEWKPRKPLPARRMGLIEQWG